MKNESMSERLRKIYKDSGLTLKEFSEKCGINYRTIQDYILINKVSIKIDILQKIATTFKINLNWLITGGGEMYIKNKSMPKAFLEQLKKDLADKDERFYEKLSFPKIRIDNALNELDTLARAEVIGLARALNQPIENYIWLAGLQPEFFDQLLDKKKIAELLKSLGEFSDKQLDEYLDLLNISFLGFKTKIEQKQQALKRS